MVYKLKLAMLHDGSGREAGTLFGFGIKGARRLLHWASVAAAPDAPLSSRGATYVANLSAHQEEDHTYHVTSYVAAVLHQSVASQLTHTDRHERN
jgi:hypothetical protein